jgi:pyruvate dehydrogenase E1 component alpha subunit
MHITHPAAGLMVTTGVVGGGIPIANGLALAAQTRGEDRVAVANFGDGAANIGAFHEALNLASLWKLPVVFVCQNNRYGEHTAYEDHAPNEHMADRSAGYAMPGVAVDGNDADAVWAVAGEAIDRARAGGGPTLIEAETFRFCGHYFGDSDHYMKDGELEAALAADPVAGYRAKLVADDVASDEDLAGLEKRIEAELDDAVEFAQSSPFPDPDEISRDVYATEVPA